MTRSRAVSRALWSIVGVTTIGSACGRIGFDGFVAGDATDATTADATDDAAPDGAPDAPPSDTLAVPSDLMLETVCGNTGPTSLPVQNPTARTITITSAATSAGFSAQTALPLTIGPGQLATIAVMPPPAVIGTDKPGDQKSGDLQLVLDAGDPIDVALTARVSGALIAATNGAGGAFDPAFTSSGGACPAGRVLSFVNTGNRPVMVTAPSLTWFAISGFTTAVVDGGSSASHTLRVQTTTPCSSSELAIYTISGESCTGSGASFGLSFSLGSTSCFCS